MMAKTHHITHGPGSDFAFDIGAIELPNRTVYACDIDAEALRQGLTSGLRSFTFHPLTEATPNPKAEASLTPAPAYVGLKYELDPLTIVVSSIVSLQRVRVTIEHELVPDAIRQADQREKYEAFMKAFQPPSRWPGFNGGLAVDAHGRTVPSMAPYERRRTRPV